MAERNWTPTPAMLSAASPRRPRDPAVVAADLAALSRWIDAGNADRDAEAVTWGRLAKIAEEAGEVIAAYIGATGQNPRKGVTHTIEDVVDELLDVAVTALGAVEHLTGNHAAALDLLTAKIGAVAERSGGGPERPSGLTPRR